MRRSSIFLLLGAILLGLLAVLAARMFLVAPSQKAPDAPKTVPLGQDWPLMQGKVPKGGRLAGSSGDPLPTEVGAG